MRLRRVFTVVTEMHLLRAWVVLAPVIVRVANRISAGNMEYSRRHALAGHPFSPDSCRIDGETPEGTTEILERQAQVEQGTHDHVARGARKAVEVQNRQTS